MIQATIPLRLIETLKSRAGQMAYSSFLYDWSLSALPPDRLLIKPVDLWKGSADKGQEILDMAGVDHETGPRWFSAWWTPEDADAQWKDNINSFLWLRDLRTLGGSVAREQGRKMIENWIERYPGWDSEAWRCDLTGQRLAMWISHYDFFCMNTDEAFEETFMTSLVKQAKHLHNTLGNIRDVEFFHGIKGLIYAGFAIEDHQKWVDQALSALEKGIERQILPDGGHASRSPALLINALEIMVDIKSALKAGDRKVPEFVDEAILTMSTAARFFRYNDRKLAVFHGSQESDTARLDLILAQCGMRGKPITSMPYSGFERAELGRSLLLLDVGKSPDYPFDANAHASPLAFEFGYGKERLFVNCGSHPHSENWNEALRFTAAHNTATLDYRNASEIRKDGHFGRKVTEFSLQREETRDAILLEASHNGFVPLNGITHKRKLYLGDEGHDLRGQDDFTCSAKLIRSVEIAVRFHLHPKVAASLIGSENEILLRMPGGIGWRLSFSAGTLALEDSLYLGTGTEPQKTKQIVIYGQMSGEAACIKWSVKRES